MKKYAPYLSLLSLLMGSSLHAQSTVIKGGFKNVVIGTGCSSTCINGKCETTCKGDGQDTQTSSDQKSGDAKVIKKDVSIETQAGKSVLRVALADGYVNMNGGGVASIHMPTLSGLRVYGNASVNFKGFEAEQVNIEVSGNANLVGDSNTFKDLSLRVDGNADADLLQSEVINTDVALSGQANAKLNFRSGEAGALAGAVSGMADVEFCGDPEQTLSVSGMADATQIKCK